MIANLVAHLVLTLALLSAAFAQAFFQAGTAAGSPGGTRKRATSTLPQNNGNEEMWERVRVCVVPAPVRERPDSYTVGVWGIGLRIAPSGDVIDTRLIGGPPLLKDAALSAVLQWKFRPNILDVEATWSRIQTVVRFNANGTTEVALAQPIVADDLSDAGRPEGSGVVPRPRNALQCKTDESTPAGPPAERQTIEPPARTGARVELVPLDGTSLQVAVPSGWQRGPVKAMGLQTVGLRQEGAPGFEITAGQMTKRSMELTTNNSLSLPYECDSMFEVMRRVSNGKTGSLLPRPEYIPQEYYSRILAAKPVENHTAIFACLYLGSSNVTIEIRPAPTAANGAKLAAMLQSIVDSSKQKSTLLYAPGRLELPSLGVTASFNHGTWAIGQRTNPAVGQVDLLIRTGGVSELKIMPAIISGRCPDVLNGAMQAKIQSDSSKPVQLKAPSFVSPAWEQSAIELQPHDGAGQILITVCLQLSQSKVLDVTLFYGSEEVPQSDAPFLAEALDEIAAAVKDRH